MMEFVMENVSQDEMKILESEGFEWYPDDMNSRDVVIEGDQLYYEMALRALGRKTK